MSVDELSEIGLARMDDAEVSQFLSTERTGVLALPDEEAPYVLPMSFGYDGEGAVYFTYVLGADSQKESLSERADRVRFLVYRADSPFQWQSVVLLGPLEAVPREEWEDAPLDDAWRPDLFESADLSRGIAVYRLRIEDQSGFRHTGLPPGFER